MEEITSNISLPYFHGISRGRIRGRRIRQSGARGSSMGAKTMSSHATTAGSVPNTLIVATCASPPKALLVFRNHLDPSAMTLVSRGRLERYWKLNGKSWTSGHLANARSVQEYPPLPPPFGRDFYYRHAQMDEFKYGIDVPKIGGQKSNFIFIETRSSQNSFRWRASLTY